jgi:hypothetical protein
VPVAFVAVKTTGTANFETAGLMPSVELKRMIATQPEWRPEHLLVAIEANGRKPQ